MCIIYLCLDIYIYIHRNVNILNSNILNKYELNSILLELG